MVVPSTECLEERLRDQDPEFDKKSLAVSSISQGNSGKLTEEDKLLDYYGSSLFFSQECKDGLAEPIRPCRVSEMRTFPSSLLSCGELAVEAGYDQWTCSV